MKKSDVYVVLAGVMWGLTGMMFKVLSAAGISQMGTVALRMGVACVAMLVYYLARYRRFPTIGLKDLPYCVGAGVLGFVMFNFSYFNAIQMTSLSMAAALLYTAPAFVILFSRFLYKEAITKTKLLALAATVAGAFLATGVLEQSGQASILGVGMGLLAGLGYAMYNLFTKAPLSRSSPESVTFYILLFGMGTSFLIEPPTRFLPLLNTPQLVLTGLGIGLVCCMLPSLLFSKGLANTDTGRASILVASELVVATAIGVLQGDPLGAGQVVGVLLLLCAIVVMNQPGKKAPQPGKSAE